MHQSVNAGARRFVGVAGEVCVPCRGQNRVVAEDLLDFQQIDAVFDQVRGIAVPQAVRGDLFLNRSRWRPGARSSARRRDPAAKWPDGRL